MAREATTLRKAGKWQPAAEFRDLPEGIRLLVVMKLAWLREHNDELEIRYPPAEP